MAEFSKQYCELNDMGLDGDFDIVEEFDKLEPGFFLPLICEGFGFSGIAKKEDDEDTIWVYMKDQESGEGDWINFELLLNDGI